MSKDYLLKITIKNNVMLERMRLAGFDSAAALAKAANVHPTQVGEFLNLKKPPIGMRGKWSELIVRIADVLRCMPEDLFPRQHLEKPLKKNTASIEASVEDIHAIASSVGQLTMAPDRLIEKRDALELADRTIAAAFLTLSAREERVLRQRFGIGARDEKTLREIGEALDVSGERIREIEAKALRKLRHPSRSKLLKEAFEAMVA